jgi:hypothetical protein
MALRDILPKGDGEKAAVRPTAAAMVRAAAVRLGRGIVLCVLFYVLFNSSSMQELFSRYIYLSLLVDQLKAIFMILSSKSEIFCVQVLRSLRGAGASTRSSFWWVI